MKKQKSSFRAFAPPADPRYPEANKVFQPAADEAAHTQLYTQYDDEPKSRKSWLCGPATAKPSYAGETVTRPVLANFTEHATPEVRAFIVRACNSHAANAALLQRAYEVLADIRHDWPGRISMEGQSLLCGLRDQIAANSGRSGEDVSTGVKCEFVRAGINRAALKSATA